jgi:ATP-binding cassette subfamily F protein uup
MVGTLLLSVQDAVITFGGRKLFEGLSFNITEGDKICLVGKNGAGKTTLMNIITGAQALDDGTRWQLAGTVIGYLRQEVVPKSGQTVFDYVFEEVTPEDGQSAEEALAMNAYKVDMVIRPLELSPDDRMDRLSGGQLRRAALARALVEDPDILLMDEPTNHLDLEVIEWLETYLKGWRGALVCVSHDKAFLANVSDKIFWLDRGRLRVSPRGFAEFDDWSTQLLEQEARELHNRERILAQELEWASRGVKARRKRNVRRLQLVKEERDRLLRDQNAFKRMMAKIDLPEVELDELSSKIVAEFKSVRKSFKEDGREIPILDKFNLRIMRGDRIGILGKNGSGKTTFLRMLIGELVPDAGTVKLKKDIEFSYFDQRRRDLDLDKTLWQTLCPDGGEHVNVRGKSRHVVGYLKDFLFDPSVVHHKVGVLSGGQKNRLMLAKVLANPKNLLILDEPTNDLDMDTLDMLEEVLIQYDGTLLVVSHDRDFLDQTVTKILAFEGAGKVEGHIGGYSDYIEAKKKNFTAGTRSSGNEKMNGKNEVGEKPRISEPPRFNPVKKLSYKLEYEFERLPGKIEKLEMEIGGLEDALAAPDFYSSDPGGFQAAAKRLALAREELENAETRWLELSEMKEAAGSGV